MNRGLAETETLAGHQRRSPEQQADRDGHRDQRDQPVQDGVLAVGHPPIVAGGGGADQTPEDPGGRPQRRGRAVWVGGALPNLRMFRA